MDPKVSVIVPVYNVEALLPRCLDSIVAQTLREIEIICVDDGSPDRSIDILRRYADGDSRIRVLSQENRGLGGADTFQRNAAVLAGTPAERYRTINAPWWYLGNINHNSTPWVGSDPYVQQLRRQTSAIRPELRKHFSRTELSIFDLDRWYALRPAVVCLLTLRRWKTSLRRRLSH